MAFEKLSCSPIPPTPNRRRHTVRGEVRSGSSVIQKGDVAHFFLLSLKAGGTGLNLTAADTVIHYGPWWNHAIMDRATDSAYCIR